jgi:hypothetical protein
MAVILVGVTGSGRRERLSGAHERIRTADLILTKDVLYLLSYMGVGAVGR